MLYRENLYFRTHKSSYRHKNAPPSEVVADLYSLLVYSMGSISYPSPGRSILGCSGLFSCLRGGLHNERSSGTAQLRFLEETAIRLRQNGFTVEPIEDHHLPVCWEKGRLCRISGRGSVLYRQECVDSVRAQDALQTVIDIAKTTSEYMAILETAPRLKASGLTGDYRVLADFSSAVLAGHPPSAASSL